MSIRSWKLEFYSTPANEVNAKDAPQHALQKWTGRLKKNLDKHKLRVCFDCNGTIEEVEGNEKFNFSDRNCAWCNLAGYVRFNYPDINCDNCQAVKAGAEIKGCTEGGLNAPWNILINTGNFKPMLNWVRKAVKLIGEDEIENICSCGGIIILVDD